MGDRAVITTRENFENDGIGIYLHWNGDEKYVAAYLRYCEMQQFRSPTEDCYGWARLCEVIANTFPDGLSIGIDVCSKLDTDNWDNGTYIIEDWKVVDRKYTQENIPTIKHFSDEELEKYLEIIDKHQPKKMQLDERFPPF